MYLSNDYANIIEFIVIPHFLASQLDFNVSKFNSNKCDPSLKVNDIK